MRKIKLLFMDVDGTLTDGKIYMGNDGETFKTFSIKDGYGIAHILKEAGIIPVIITARQSDIVKKRCSELGINHCFQNCSNKKEKMLEICELYDIAPNEDGQLSYTAYIGDDMMDIECMEVSELCGCPQNAVAEVLNVADFVASCNGGDGAVREFIEWIVNDV